MKKKYVYIGAVAVILAAAASYFLFFRKNAIESRLDQLKKNPHAVRQFDEDLVKQLQIALKDGKKSEGEPSFEEMIALLRNRYEKNINHGWVQVRMLNELMGYFKKKYPADWLDHIYELVRASFPAMADQIMEVLKKLEEYNEWALKNRSEISQLSGKERRDFLWNKRRELFGDVADEIWAGELRKDRVAETLDKIKGSADVPFTEKVSMYRGAINNAYEVNAEAFVKNHQLELVNNFLNVDTVQGELAQMSTEDKRVAMRDIRRAMGYDEAAVSRLEKLDETRDVEWENGGKYLKERDELSAKYKGSELESKLDEIRKKYFGDQAEIIKNEESVNFFRYKQKRVYGRN